jgi:hypothetical protein
LLLLSVAGVLQAETMIDPYFKPDYGLIYDVIGVRYKCKVIQNQVRGQPLIIFGFHRTYGSAVATYLLESNLYDNSLRYRDGAMSWAEVTGGDDANASLRVALAEIFNVVHCGAKTLSSDMFPCITYWTDGCGWQKASRDRKSDRSSKRDGDATEPGGQSRAPFHRGDNNR